MELVTVADRVTAGAVVVTVVAVAVMALAYQSIYMIVDRLPMHRDFVDVM